MEAPHGYFITVNFQDFVFLSEESGCAGGYLELSDGVHDSDHMRRYCSSVMRSRQWFTSSNKLLLEYLVDAEDTFSNFAIREGSIKNLLKKSGIFQTYGRPPLPPLEVWNPIFFF